MDADYKYRLLFQCFMAATYDGIVVVDCDGIITEINQRYCDFLGKSKEETVGRPIGEVISTTSMYEVLERRQRGDGPSGVYLQLYSETDNKNKVETHAVGNRFCIFDEDILLGAAAQVSFKERAVAISSSLMEEELNYYKEQYQNTNTPMGGFDQIIGNSPQIQGLKRLAMKVSKRDFPVLITGETGTGKELFAKALHSESSRHDKPIITINCAAIPADLLESELFGYEEGAFTGAKRGGKMGKFQLADGGTLFLDEIGDMAPALQAKLLRVLQEREVEKVGGGMPIPIDVRIIAATRQNLPEMIEQGTFREDLYYRLSVINLEMIPLRQRPDDVLLYAQDTLNNLNEQYKTNIVLSDVVKWRLQEYAWPGNVREVINVITSAYASCELLMIDEVDLPAKLLASSRNNVNASTKRLAEMVGDYETAIIRDALRRHNFSCRNAAEELGLDRSLLYKKMRKSGIQLKKELCEANI